jgi:hypothetical protein
MKIVSLRFATLNHNSISLIFDVFVISGSWAWRCWKMWQQLLGNRTPSEADLVPSLCRLGFKEQRTVYRAELTRVCRASLSISLMTQRWMRIISARTGKITLMCTSMPRKIHRSTWSTCSTCSTRESLSVPQDDAVYFAGAVDWVDPEEHRE